VSACPQQPLPTPKPASCCPPPTAGSAWVAGIRRLPVGKSCCNRRAAVPSSLCCLPASWHPPRISHLHSTLTALPGRVPSINSPRTLLLLPPCHPAPSSSPQGLCVTLPDLHLGCGVLDNPLPGEGEPARGLHVTFIWMQPPPVHPRLDTIKSCHPLCCHSASPNVPPPLLVLGAGAGDCAAGLPQPGLLQGGGAAAHADSQKGRRRWGAGGKLVCHTRNLETGVFSEPSPAPLHVHLLHSSSCAHSLHTVLKHPSANH
jgi:hypothetical protein